MGGGGGGSEKQTDNTEEMGVARAPTPDPQTGQRQNCMCVHNRVSANKPQAAKPRRGSPCWVVSDPSALGSSHQ